MAIRLKLRISRAFQSCRSKDPSNLPEDPVPSFPRLPTTTLFNVDFPPPTPPPSKPRRSSFKRHVSSAFNSVGCGFGSKSAPPYASYSDGIESPEFKWQKEGKWHVVAKVYDETPRRKIYNSSASGNSEDEYFPPPPPALEKKKRRNRKKKTTAAARLRLSTSSAESGLFSSEGEGGDERDEEETETLVSSRSFSTDSSSEFNPQLETIRETPIAARRAKTKKKVKRAKCSVATKANTNYNKVKLMCRSSVSSAEGESPARLSMFKKLIPGCAVEGKVKESFAVVKKSEDPYEDFKRSMMEMILEKQMFEAGDLEQLLQCFLSLNSKHHHGVIVEAFAEIWEYLFSTTSSTYQQSPSRPLFEL